jgi:hypothetical protein
MLGLAREMFRVIRPDAMQFIQQLLTDQLGRGVLHPVDDAMAYSFDRCEVRLCFEPINQGVGRRFVISGGHFGTGRRYSLRVPKRQIRPA